MLDMHFRLGLDILPIFWFELDLPYQSLIKRLNEAFPVPSALTLD